MMVSVKAIRDSDGTLLGETVFDITDKEGRSAAIADLLNAIYANLSPGTVALPPFTFRFDKAANSN
jgi:hypothetical protein